MGWLYWGQEVEDLHQVDSKGSWCLRFLVPGVTRAHGPGHSGSWVSGGGPTPRLALRRAVLKQLVLEAKGSLESLLPTWLGKPN